jgi:hypothetical protein
VLLKMALALDPPVRVILDVGAQVLEVENEEIARVALKEGVKWGGNLKTSQKDGYK